MNVLLDANSLIWWVTGSSRLSDTAREQIAAAGNDILIGIGSVWEIAIKRSLGKLSFPHDFEAVLHDENFALLPIGYAHLRALEDLPHHHRDPFDRLLIAQSIAEKLPIVTSDKVFALYPVATVW